MASAMEDPQGGWSRARAAFDTVGHGPLVGLEHVPDSRPDRGDEHLLALVEAHIQAEGHDLEGYRELAASSDPVISELMKLVVEDEERHHALLKRLATRLRDDLTWESSKGALPADAAPEAAVPHDPELVKGFVGHEHQGVRYLETLAREARDLKRPLAALLLDSMALDSRKHELVLSYIAGRLGGVR